MCGQVRMDTGSPLTDRAARTKANPWAEHPCSLSQNHLLRILATQAPGECSPEIKCERIEIRTQGEQPFVPGSHHGGGFLEILVNLFGSLPPRGETVQFRDETRVERSCSPIALGPLYLRCRVGSQGRSSLSLISFRTPAMRSERSSNFFTSGEMIGFCITSRESPSYDAESDLFIQKSISSDTDIPY